MTFRAAAPFLAGDMDEDQDQGERDSPAPAAGGISVPQGEPQTPFDLWLNRSLHALYDSVTTEPIPPELLKLIEEDRERRKG